MRETCRVFFFDKIKFGKFVRKDYVTEKFQLHHRESNPRPAGLYRSALTTTQPRAPLWKICKLKKKVKVNFHPITCHEVPEVE